MQRKKYWRYAWMLVFGFIVTACNSIAPVNTPVVEIVPSMVLASATSIAITEITPEVPTVIPTETIIPTMTSIPRTELIFTGVIVPARCVQAAIDERGDANYIYDEVRDIIQGADIAVGTLNATLTDFPPHTGCVSTYVLVGSPDNADAMQSAGFDVMSVATNHIKNCGLTNCGDIAFFDTLDNLNRVGILPVGAGENLAAGMKPVVIEINGIRFGFVSLGEIEELAFADENTPGIGVLTEENWRAAIQATHLVADVVIAMPHSGPENVPNPSAYQQKWARIAVEEGAHLVVGNHTHVAQAYQELEGVMVFYGLGNFVFDQTWAADHQQGLILRVVFEGDSLVGYELIPTVVDGDGTVHLADEELAKEILERIQAAAANLPD